MDNWYEHQQPAYERFVARLEQDGCTFVHTIDKYRAIFWDPIENCYLLVKRGYGVIGADKASEADRGLWR